MSKQDMHEDGKLLRGMVFGLLISIPIWVFLGLVAWALVAWL